MLLNSTFARFFRIAVLTGTAFLPTGMAHAQLQPQTFVYKAVDGISIEADVYVPEDAGNEKRPVIAWFHGGALIMGNRSGVPPQLRDLSRKEKFVLVSFDYRLAPEVKLPGIIADVKDGLEWLRETGPGKFGADPDRMVVAGASAGGYLTLMSGAILDPPPTALVSYWGYGDVDGDWVTKLNAGLGKSGLSKEEAWGALDGKVTTGSDKESGKGRAGFFLYLKSNGLWGKVVGGFDPATESEKFIPYCPVKNVSENYPPTLLLHGTKDRDVPYEKSLDMARVLKEAGVSHELITVEGGGHGLWGGDREKVEAAFDRSLEYIREKLTDE